MKFISIYALYAYIQGNLESNSYNFVPWKQVCKHWTQWNQRGHQLYTNVHNFGIISFLALKFDISDNQLFPYISTSAVIIIPQVHQLSTCSFFSFSLPPFLPCFSLPPSIPSFFSFKHGLGQVRSLSHWELMLLLQKTLVSSQYPVSGVLWLPVNLAPWNITPLVSIGTFTNIHSYPYIHKNI